jgi:hypothetical protein
MRTAKNCHTPSHRPFGRLFTLLLCKVLRMHRQWWITALAAMAVWPTLGHAGEEQVRIGSSGRFIQPNPSTVIMLPCSIDLLLRTCAIDLFGRS